MHRIIALPKWVLIKKFCELTGYTPDAVNGKIKNGVWLKDVHWRKGPDGHRFINLESYEEWVEGR